MLSLRTLTKYNLNGTAYCDSNLQLSLSNFIINKVVMKILTNRRNKNAIRGPQTKMQKICSIGHLLMATSQTLTQNLPEVLSEHKLYQR